MDCPSAQRLPGRSSARWPGMAIASMTSYIAQAKSQPAAAIHCRAATPNPGAAGDLERTVQRTAGWGTRVDLEFEGWCRRFGCWGLDVQVSNSAGSNSICH